MRRISSLVLAGAVLAAGCSATVTSPSPTPAAPVRVSVVQNPTFAGGMAVFTLRVDNISPSVVDLTFPSSCQVLPYFTERATGRAVTPLGGGFACLTVITGQTLRPGESFSRTHTVKSGTAHEADFIVLPPGEYTIHARLEDAVYKLNSEPVAFTVR